ncbi:MAG: autotransporter outer membrane beta-barrel domain-containing protein [Deltaproteobacteria bacterium]|jgi:hypothetical protein|nr:autotransporter outer membrane beta-barrel domain-containing protein [Deltaproteobacteria bacterium]
MKKLFLCLLVFALTQSFASADASDRDEAARTFRSKAMDYQAGLALRPPVSKDAPSAGFGAGPLVLVMVPEFHYTSTQATKGTIDGHRFKMDSGHSETGSFLVTGTKPLTDVFSLGFFYQYAMGTYKGGLMVADLPVLSGASDVRVNSHVIGILGNFNFAQYGRLETSLLQVFEDFSGNETVVSPGGPDTQSQNDFKDRATSLMAWYMLDFQASPSVTLTPYLGWRSIYVVLKNQTDWANNPDDRVDSHAWTHLGTAGLKATWHAGLLSLNARLGVNRRISKNDVPGFTSRATAPGVAHLGWNNSWDRNLVSWGAGLGYVVPEIFVFEIGYNGFAGSDTSAHTFNLAAIFPF